MKKKPKNIVFLKIGSHQKKKVICYFNKVKIKRNIETKETKLLWLSHSFILHIQSFINCYWFSLYDSSTFVFSFSYFHCDFHILNLYSIPTGVVLQWIYNFSCYHQGWLLFIQHHKILYLFSFSKHFHNSLLFMSVFLSEDDTEPLD